MANQQEVPPCYASLWTGFYADAQTTNLSPRPRTGITRKSAKTIAARN